MGTSPLFSLLFLLFLLRFSNAHLHKLKLSTSELHLRSPKAAPSPTTFFEVTRPVPSSNSSCSLLLLQHDFASTYSKPPATASYAPPRCLRRHLRRRSPVRAVLEWSAASTASSASGSAASSSSAAAPPSPAPPASSDVRKDVTKYSSLFTSPQTLAVYLGNLVDSTYTGIYHVNVSLHFYFDSALAGASSHRRPPAFTSPADLVLPISRNLPLDDGLWFPIQNSTDVQSKHLAIPRNAYRAVVEVYISFHQDDEFWYTNPPDSYISANNFTGVPGNGAFREVTVR
ncbi:Peptide-N4-(N-acetyl-beta-glucosaminyl)asparagine amidase A [Ananas comosus]|uniref:Peptide-N4-(N-acetyl-beta-glucosaminyl)asparagine amidase A n=1 Tax=Ananas comosus TaxID=4615 RepID=A0A199VZS8_ANACO|nr:Peptide-N4-(N-acetyl-beta-glucosaminyl)asparagine amidase A [Ananas comosus]